MTPWRTPAALPVLRTLWEAVIPGSEHFDDELSRAVVVCFYWVDVAAGTVRCDSFASLSLPA